MKTLLGSKFHNSNGRDYEVLQVQGFNDDDKEYYKNSWQKQYCALLQVPHTESYVVAMYLGETSWGYGYYYDNREDAEQKYNLEVAGYEV